MNNDTAVSSPGGKGGDTCLGKNEGDLGVPNRQNPPLGFTNEIQRNASNTFGISSAAGAVDDNYVKADTKQLSKLHSGFFCWGLLPFITCL